MGLKDLYYKLENKYYGFLDRVPALYKIVDAFESNNIPTFPLFLLVVVIVLGLIGFFVWNAFFAQALVTVTLKSGNQLVSGEKVFAAFAGAELEKISSTAGKIEFSAPLGAEVLVRLIESTEFEAAQKLFAVESMAQEIVLELVPLEAEFARTIRLLDKSGKVFEQSATISFSCSENTEFAQTKTSGTGVIELQGVPSDCGELIARGVNVSAAEETFSLESESIAITLSQEAGAVGSAVVFVKDSEGKALVGMRVQLIAVSGGETANLGTARTDETGSARIGGVPVGLYSVQASDSSGQYFAELSEAKAVAEEEATSFEVEMSAAAAGSIKFLIVDSGTSAPIEGVAAKLFKGDALVQTLVSGADGKIEFKVPENISYSVSFDHPQYIRPPNIFPATISGAEREVKLVKANELNATTLTVKIVDEKGAPVERVNVKLVNASDSSVVEEKVTGANGTAGFERLQEDEYIVSALKPGFGSKSSPLVEVKARQENTVEIVLPIGNGALNVMVLDSENNPVPNALLKVVDIYSGQALSEQIAESDGKKVLGVRADKEVYVIASSGEFLPTHSVPAKMQKDVSKELVVVLERDAAKLEAEFLGLFAGDVMEVKDSVAPGQRYTAKFRLRVPKGTSYSEAGVHLRVGGIEVSEEQRIAEQEPIVIKEVKAAKAVAVMGKSYNPPNNFAEDLKHLTQSNAKWANVVLSNVSGGVYDIEAVVQVKDSAAAGKNIEARYMAWGKTAGGTIRYPSDPELGQGDSTSSRQGLYAKTLARQYSIGPSSLCSEGYCSVYKIGDLSTGIETAIVSEYSARVSTSYRLSFNISYALAAAKPDSVLKVRALDAGVAFTDYSISATNAPNKTAENIEAVEIETVIGALQKDSSASGWIGFEAKNSGSTRVVVEIVSNNESVYSKEILVSIAPAKEVSLEMVPKTVVPYIANNILFKATEKGSDPEIPIASAAINIYLDGSLMQGLETQGNGTAEYSLNNPQNNSELKIVVQKEGFDVLEKELLVSEASVLGFEPSSVEEALTITTATEKERSVELINATQIPLSIKKVSLPGFKGKIRTKIEKQLIVDTVRSSQSLDGMELGVDENFSVIITVSLTEKGQLVDEVEALTGTIDLLVENNDYGTWLVQIPLTITIGFGEEVDSTDCFSVTPTKWSFSTEKDQKQLEVLVKNECTVLDNFVDLRDLQAKVVLGNENEIGKFSASAPELPEAKEVQLSQQYRKISPLVPKNREAALLLVFDPVGIASGHNTPQILVKATNKTNNGDQELVQKINVESWINNLSQCVKIIPSTTSIESSPYGIGFGSYPSYSSPTDNWGREQTPPYLMPNVYREDPFQKYGYGGAQGYGTGYYGGGAYGYDYGYGYPNTGFSSQYMEPYGNQYYSSQFGFNPEGGMYWDNSSSIVRIQNECSSPVEVSVEANPSLLFDESAITLQPGETERLGVQAGYRIGRYPATFLAKNAQSQDNAKEIKTLLFTIRSATDVVRDCIKLDRTKFKFNDFVGRPVKGHIYNDCWDTGVRLIGSADAIMLAEESPELTERIGAVGSNAQLGGGVRILGTPYTTSGGLNGGTREVVEFEIERDFRYREQPTLDKTGNLFQQMGNLRYWLNRGYYTVNATGTLTVRFQDYLGRMQAKPFYVTLEDNWKALEIIPSAIDGDPNLENLQECIRENALSATLDDAWFGGVEENTGAFKPELYGTGKLVIVDSKHCSSLDSLSNLRAVPAEQNGIKIVPALDGLVAKNNIVLQIDRTNVAKGSEKKYSATWTAELESYSAKKAGIMDVAKKQTVNIKVDITIKRGMSDELPPEQITLCAGDKGESGAGAKPKVLYNWSADYWKSNATKCDSGERKTDYVYCDAVQMALSLAEKAKKVEAVVDAVKDKKVEGATKNSLNIYRFAKTSKETTDGTTQLAFYTTSAGKILSNSKLEKEAEFKKFVDAIKSQGKNIPNEDAVEAVVSNTSQLLDALGGKDYAQDIVLEAAADALKENETLKALGAENGVLAFNEYKAMHEAIDANSDCKTKTACTINGTEVTAEFLKELYSKGTFKVGIQNKEGLEKELVDKVLDSAGNAEGAEALDKEFYYENIAFGSYLVTDNYSEKFGEEFGKKHGGGVGAWEFKESAGSGKKERKVSEPGLYDVKLVHDWSDSGAVKVSVVIGEKLEAPEKDSGLYYLPFDAMIGGADNDFGTSFDKAGDAWKTMHIGEPTADNLFSPIELGNGYRKISAHEYIADYAGLPEEAKKLGKVAGLTKTSFKFYPTQKIVLNASITSNAAKSMEYRLKENGAELSKDVMAYWDKVSESTQAVCQYIKGAPASTRSVSGTQGTLKANLFLPYVNKYEMVVVCSNQRANVSTENSSVTVTGLETSAMKTLLLKQAEEQPTLQEMLDLVGSGEMCIKDSKDSTELYWK